MPSLSRYGQTEAAFHNIGLQPASSPEHWRAVPGGRVADRLHSLIHAKCAERGGTVEALEVMASVARMSEATIRRYIAEQITPPEKGRP